MLFFVRNNSLVILVNANRDSYIFSLLAVLLLIFGFFTVKFHIAHLFEVQGKVKGAKERYELLLKDKTIDTSLRADIFRQLGKLQIRCLTF